MDSVRRASGFLFYLLGVIIVPLIVAYGRGLLPAGAMPVIHSLDLPLLFVAMLFGGSSLYVSLTKGKSSLPLLIVVFAPLAVVFGVFCWFNFAMPFAEVF